MRFSKNLVFKDVEDEEETLRQIKQGYDIFNIYLLCKTDNQNLFELFELSELLIPFYEKKDYEVLGIAHGKQKGIELAKEIIESYYNKTGSLEGIKSSL